MLLKGSAIIKIQCSECLAISNKFRVYLYEDEEVQLWEVGKKGLPISWTVEENSDFYQDDEDKIVNGGCPKHPC